MRATTPLAGEASARNTAAVVPEATPASAENCSRITGWTRGAPKPAISPVKAARSTRACSREGARRVRSPPLR